LADRAMIWHRFILVGLALRENKKMVDKITKGARMHA
jgi:hypothetical protein